MREGGTHKLLGLLLAVPIDGGSQRESTQRSGTILPPIPRLSTYIYTGAARSEFKLLVLKALDIPLLVVSIAKSMNKKRDNNWLNFLVFRDLILS